MKSELLARSPMLVLPLIALVLFIAVFMAMVVVTMKRRAQAYDPLARLPLIDDTDETDDADEKVHNERGALR